MAAVTSIPINMQLHVVNGIPRLIAKSVEPIVPVKAVTPIKPPVRDKAAIGRHLIYASVLAMRGQETMPSVELLKRLQESQEWQIVKGKAFTMLMMSKYFKPFGVKPGNLHDMKRGYHKRHLIDALI